MAAAGGGGGNVPRLPKFKVGDVVPYGYGKRPLTATIKGVYDNADYPGKYSYKIEYVNERGKLETNYVAETILSASKRLHNKRTARLNPQPHPEPENEDPKPPEGGRRKRKTSKRKINKRKNTRKAK